MRTPEESSSGTGPLSFRFYWQVEEELQEQDFLDRCFQEMLDEEDQDWFIPARDLPQTVGHLQQQLNGLSVGDSHESEDILVRAFSSSTCNILKRIWCLES